MVTPSELQHVIFPTISKTYKIKGLDHKDPFASLKNDIAAYSQLSEVLIVGDFNARTTSEQASILHCKEDRNPIWLTEERNHQWTRVLEDNKSSNLFGGTTTYSMWGI
jgi:hypothetical protein